MQVLRPVQEQVPFTYTAVVCRPETRTRTVQVCNYVPEQRTKEVRFTEMVPEQRERTVNVTRFETVPQTREVPYTVCVPYTEEQQVQVRVCKLVPKTIQVPTGNCNVCGAAVGGDLTGHVAYDEEGAVPEERLQTLRPRLARRLERRGL